MTGLGSGLSRSRLQTMAVGLGFRAALSRGDATVFQNPDDRAFLIGRKWVTPGSATLITGSGVDLDRFHAVDRTSRPPAAPVVVMTARLLGSKGVAEFVEVAHRIRHRWPAARFLLAGEPDSNHPDSVAEPWLHQQPDIEYLGHLSNVVPLLHKADIFLYPSLYREGVPRVVMEAAATGLPTVAFDIPGVREAVRNNETGRLIASRDLDAMTSAVADLIERQDRRLSFGSAARTLANELFDSRSIQRQYLALYRSLGVPA
jgi:glycosyltransferase involved in cell wall biosynthesis